MPSDPIRETRRWIETIVIGLNLCPFARRVFDGELIRYCVSDAKSRAELLIDLERELQNLAATPINGIETSILIHPRVLQDFLDYNDFLSEADELLASLDLTGVVQIASFHPDYQFAGTDSDAVENFTNRSPYPMLHLLREESVSKFAGDPEFLAGIPNRNISLLRGLGRVALQNILLK